MIDSVESILWYLIPALFVIWYISSGLHVTDQWERKPMKRWGKYLRTLGPGITWAEPFSSKVIETVNVNDQVDNVFGKLGYKSQPTLQTHDNVPVNFVLTLTYRITRPDLFVLEIDDNYNSLWARTVSCVSEFVSKTELAEILHDRQTLYASMMPSLQAMVTPWGVDIKAIELNNVSVADNSILEAMVMKARAQKEAEAELTRAQMQTLIAEQLKLAAAAYDDPAWKLKGFETLLELCRSAENNTIMIPTDLVSALARVVQK